MRVFAAVEEGAATFLVPLGMFYARYDTNPDFVVIQPRRGILMGMFPFMMGGLISLPQMDRVRWIMFPEVRVQITDTLFDDTIEDADLPSIMRVMDLQQE